MLTVRDTIVKRRRFLYLAASLAIVDDQQKRLAEAEEQQMATPPRRKTQRKVLQYSFRVEASTICQFMSKVCKAIITVYKDEMLCCPKSEEEWKEVSAMFSSRFNYHNCLGAVDGKHITIKKPPNAGSYYYNYKGFQSIVLRAVADTTYKFLYVDVWAKGGALDGGTWSNCSLHYAVEENRAGVPQPEQLPNDDHPMPYHLVGDDAFALQTWMMKIFSQRSQVLRECIYSYRLSRA
ncbi:putative nuclease HARBI1 [Palaemon carinicauda]|uniref:putative nuclease HARBI1 n=1 Tax=Palaemon carinicauda TaxID=392227 RepID=UPI0035B62D46